MTALSADILAEIEAAADAQYDANPGKPLTPAIAEQIRPLLPSIETGQQAA